MSFLKIVLATGFILTIVFTVVVLFFVWYDKYVPDSLIIAWFGAMSVEAVSGVLLKVKEWRKND